MRHDPEFDLALASAVSDYLQKNADKDSSAEQVLMSLYGMLLPSANLIAYDVVRKCRLSAKIVEDMLQDACIVLLSVVRSYRPARGRFIPFWKVCLHNHLIDRYCGRKELMLSIEPRGEAEDPIDQMTVLEVRELWNQRIDALQKPLYSAVLQDRIFAEVRLTQKQVAAKFGVTRGYIARIESWMKSEIRRSVGLEP